MEKGYFDDKTRRKLFNYCLLIGIIFLIASIIVLTFCKGVYSCKEPSRFEKQEQLDEAMRNNPDEAAVSIEAKDICKVRKTDCNFHIVSVVLILVSLKMIFVLKSSVCLNLMKLLRKKLLRLFLIQPGISLPTVLKRYISKHYSLLSICHIFLLTINAFPD